MTQIQHEVLDFAVLCYQVQVRSLSPLQLLSKVCRHGNDANDSNADITGLVNLLKDWATFHQSLSGQPEPVFDRQSLQPVSLTLSVCSAIRPFWHSLHSTEYIWQLS